MYFQSNNVFRSLHDSNNDIGHFWDALDAAFGYLRFVDDVYASDACMKLTTYYWREIYISDDHSGNNVTGVCVSESLACAEGFVDLYGDELWPQAEGNRQHLQYPTGDASFMYPGQRNGIVGKLSTSGCWWDEARSTYIAVISVS